MLLSLTARRRACIAATLNSLGFLPSGTSSTASAKGLKAKAGVDGATVALSPASTSPSARTITLSTPSRRRWFDNKTPDANFFLPSRCQATSVDGKPLAEQARPLKRATYLRVIRESCAAASLHGVAVAMA